MEGEEGEMGGGSDQHEDDIMVKLGQPEHGHNEQTATGAPGAWEGEASQASSSNRCVTLSLHRRRRFPFCRARGYNYNVWGGAGLHKNQPCEGNGGSKGSRQV